MIPRAPMRILVVLLLTWRVSPAPAVGDVPYLVKDIHPTASSAPDSLTKVGDKIYFSAGDGVHGRELWVSNGTDAGTRMVLDVLPGAESGDALSIRAVGGRAFFQAFNASDGIDLWVSDASSKGTSLLVNISDGPWFAQMESIENLLEPVS